MAEILYKLDTFEGPLDLLLSLIAKNKIDINDIPIAVLCDQYMEYIAAAEKMDMELSADFIVMASELMLIKSRMLLPRNEEEDEEDPRAALAAALLEYKRAKAAAEDLRERFGEYGLRMIKDTDEITVDKSYVADHDLSLLTKAYLRVLNSEKITDADVKRNFDPLIEVKQVPIKSVVRKMSAKLQKDGGAGIYEIFMEADSRTELIAMFMALLELLKSGHLLIEAEMSNPDGYEDGIGNSSDGGVIDVMDDVRIVLADGMKAEDLSGAVADDI